MLSSLPLQVCLYFNGWYDAFFTIIMCVLYIWKANALPYPAELHGMLALEIVIVFILAGIEWARLFLATKGNKTERAGPLIMSTVLSIPSGVAFAYFLTLQVGPRPRVPWLSTTAPTGAMRLRPPSGPRRCPVASAPEADDRALRHPRRHEPGHARPTPPSCTAGPQPRLAARPSATRPTPSADLRDACGRDLRRHRTRLHRHRVGTLAAHRAHIHEGARRQLKRAEWRGEFESVQDSSSSSSWPAVGLLAPAALLGRRAQRQSACVRGFVPNCPCNCLSVVMTWDPSEVPYGVLTIACVLSVTRGPRALGVLILWVRVRSWFVELWRQSAKPSRQPGTSLPRPSQSSSRGACACSNACVTRFLPSASTSG